MSFDIAIDTAVRQLTLVEQAVLKTRFGIPAGDARERSALHSPLSAAQARRIERRALRKLRDDAAPHRSKRVHLTTPCRPDWRSMENAELLNMAVFKLHDCAQRMLALAQAAQSPALGAKFLTVYRQLLEEEAGLRTEALAAATTPRRVKSPALTAA